MDIGFKRQIYDMIARVPPDRWPSVVAVFRQRRSIVEASCGRGSTTRARLAQELSLDARLALARECMSRRVERGSVLVFVDNADDDARFHVIDVLTFARERGLPVPT